MTNPVVQVVEESTQEVVYTLRIKGTSFRPKVFSLGAYTVHVGNQDDDEMQTFSGLEAVASQDSGELAVSFEPQYNPAGLKDPPGYTAGLASQVTRTTRRVSRTHRVQL